MKKRREIKEKVTKEFLINLLAPFHPTLKTGEKIANLSIKTYMNDFDFVYVIIEEGGVENSTKLRKGDQV